MARRSRLIESRGAEPRRRPGEPEETGQAASPTSTRPVVVTLDDPAALDATLSGAKAAALATAATAGLPVLPGVVITTAAPDGLVDGDRELPEPFRGHLRVAWDRLSDRGRRPLAVRSSSTVEDGTVSSMAGVFTSVLDVSGWPALVEAIRAVLRSSGDEPMAVLLQPMLDAARGGVLFGLDPVTGRDDRFVVEVVSGGPNSLVSGVESGTRHVVGRHGRLLEADTHDGAVRLGRRDRRSLAELARATATVFGRPQDVEWAIDRTGMLWLLQSRPVTAVGRAGTARGPRLGPGPVAETLPDALAPLEEDLWVDPLRAGIVEALTVIGDRARRALDRSPVVVTVGGRIAADLDLLDATGTPPSLLARLDPRPPGRRLAAAWRVGRLRRSLPLLHADLVAAVDTELRSIPELTTLDDDELLVLLDRTRLALRAVHGHEVLAGILGGSEGTTAAALALDALARGRRAGLDDDELVARAPVVLALAPPALGRSPRLPDVAIRTANAGTLDDLGSREALRLRARWLQELAGRAAVVLGDRLETRGALLGGWLVRWLRLTELHDVVIGRPTPADLPVRAAAPAGPPLPTMFRLTAEGDVVAERPRGARRLEGRGAGGGRGMGRVHDPLDGPPVPGTVLVVRTLEPGLAASLPGLAGLVAETGSVLSHLAILARELGVPTVVGVADALRRFPPGATVVVDGTTGEVDLVTEAAP